MRTRTESSSSETGATGIDGSAAPGAEVASGPTASRRWPRLPGPTVQGATRGASHGFFGRYAVLGVLALLVLGFSLGMPSTFATSSNALAMLSSQGIYLIMAVGLLFPLRKGRFDLSIGTNMNVAMCIVAVLTVSHHVNAAAAAIVAIAFAGGVGLVNGILVEVIGLDGFIATLGTMTVLGGIAYGLTNTQVIVNIPPSILDFARFQVGPVPAIAIYGWVLCIIAWYALEFTPLGRQLLFMGGSEDAARLIGLRVRAVGVMVFVISGLAAGFAGVVLLGNLGAADPSIGAEYLLSPYAAAFLGTTLIQVGRFNVFGTLFALYLLVVGVTGLELLGAASWVANIFNGGALVVAIVMARWIQVRSDR
jgi:ribose transport system permease protein